MQNDLEKRFTAYLKKTLRGYKHRRQEQEKLTQEEFNEIIEQKVSLQKYLEKTKDELEILDINSDCPEKAFTNREYYEAMKKVDKRQKKALYLLVVDELTAEQVGKILDTSASNAKKLKEKAIKNFKKNLRAKNGK